MSLDYVPALIYLTTELLRRDNIASYRYKIINWGLVLLRAGTLCAPGLFILLQQEVRNLKPTFYGPTRHKEVYFATGISLSGFRYRRNGARSTAWSELIMEMRRR